jgi:mRNA-degrading endonuclease RelE of RelBE toxin-antitoxin system
MVMHQKESHTLSYPCADLEPSDWLRFVQLDPFTKKWSKLGLLDDDLRALEIVIMSTGERLPVIPGAGGLRKLRLSQEGSNRGKRDSFRVCYALFPDYGIVLLVTVFGKNEKSDLSAADRNAISKVIKTIQDELDQGTIR